MRKSFLPKSDESLLRWSLNFSTLISASPLLFGLTASLASSYATLHASFAAGVAACDAGERNRSAVLTKNAARAALKTQAGLLSKLVEGTGSVTDAQKAQLGLNVRKTPTIQPVPSTPPVVETKSVQSNIVKILLKAAGNTKRSKPPSVRAAQIYTYVGETAPNDPNAFRFEGSTTRTEATIEFPTSLPPFSKVWITALWVNNREQAGPASTPFAVNLGTWSTQSAEESTGDDQVRIAA